MIEGMMPRLGMLVSFLWVLTAGVSAAEDEEPLRSIAAIHAIAPGELDRGCQVRFEGIVTLSPGGQVVQQEDHGIYIATGADHTELVDARPGASGPARLAVGMLVEIEGRAIRGGWTPNVLPSRIRIMGEAPLPQPAPLDLARLYSGADSGRRVMATGIVQSLRRVSGGRVLTFETGSRRLTVELPDGVWSEGDEALAARLIDARVRVVGVGRSYWNSRGEFLAPGLVVARTADLTVVAPPPASALEAPQLPLESIARYRGLTAGGHRVRTPGVVSFALPETLYLQEGTGGVRIDLAAPAAAGFVAGDRVEVSGFPDMTRQIGGLTAAVARRIERGPPPEPRAIQPSEIMRLNRTHEAAGTMAAPGTFDGCLVRVRAGRALRCGRDRQPVRRHEDRHARGHRPAALSQRDRHAAHECAAGAMCRASLPRFARLGGRHRPASAGSSSTTRASSFPARFASTSPAPPQTPRRPTRSSSRARARVSSRSSPRPC